MLKTITTILICTTITSLIQLVAQTTFECENKFYLSEHQLDTINVKTNIYQIHIDNNNLEMELFSVYDIHFNGIAMNPFDGLIYGFITKTQEVVRIFPNGSYQILGHPQGLLDYDEFFTAASFDDLGRYVLTGFNQFTARMDVSCDTVILLDQIERTIIDLALDVSHFGDIAFHPSNGLLYGVNSPAQRLANINTSTGEVTHIGLRNQQTNVGALFFDPEGNLFGYENNEFYSIDITTGRIRVIDTTNIPTYAKDGCSCLRLNPNKLHFEILTNISACEKFAMINVIGSKSGIQTEYLWYENEEEIINSNFPNLQIENNGIYSVDITLTDYCGNLIHKERHDVEIKFPRKFLFESVDVSNEFCFGSNASIQTHFNAVHGTVEVSSENEAAENGVFENLSAGLYAITATTESGCVTDTLIEITNTICELYIPSAFSPNHDGINDELIFLSNPQAQFDIVRYEIYDRWGNRIYSAPAFKNQPGSYWWNGYVDNQLVNPGVYVLVYDVLWPDQTTIHGSQVLTVLD